MRATCSFYLVHLRLIAVTIPTEKYNLGSFSSCCITFGSLPYICTVTMWWCTINFRHLELAGRNFRSSQHWNEMKFLRYLKIWNFGSMEIINIREYLCSYYDISWSGSESSRILTFCPRWRWVAIVTLRPLYPRSRGLAGSQIWPGDSGGEEKAQPTARHFTNS
jgi:hypothetical protein